MLLLLAFFGKQEFTMTVFTTYTRKVDFAVPLILLEFLCG